MPSERPPLHAGHSIDPAIRALLVECHDVFEELDKALAFFVGSRKWEPHPVMAKIGAALNEGA